MDESRELARGFAAGETWAYEAAYRIHGRLLHAVARGILRDASDAQDCVHDVLTRLWRAGTSYREARGSLRAFLTVCVRNDALARVRNAGARERIAARTLEPENQADPSEGVVARVAVRRAMEALDDKQRRTIEMAYFDGLTHREIAERTGEPVGTVKSRLSEALRRLRGALLVTESSHA